MLRYTVCECAAVAVRTISESERRTYGVTHVRGGGGVAWKEECEANLRAGYRVVFVHCSQ